jgi:Kef-type K+ transport system membrane component KefB/Trk K+ transport system NAD-binding subunit
MSPDGIFLELSFIIVVGAVVSIVMRLLRQPLILGYILTGILVGPAAFNLIHLDTFDAFASIGIALLLFIIGLGMNISVIKKLGGTVFLAAGAELLTVGAAGFVVSSLLGLTRIEAFIIGLCLFFSSTIIIVKILSDKKEQNRLHGQIAIGIVLLDDIVATLALLFVAAGKNSTVGLSRLGMLATQGALLMAFLVIMSTVLLPRIVKFMAKSQEMLFLFAVGWGFGVASLFQLAGFSIEIGALFAGVSLAGLPYATEIESRLKPLRDFFVVLFFIVLGKSLSLSGLSEALWPALALSAVVVLLKPAVIIATLGSIGYPKRVSFMAAINLSQVSEFSIVLAVLAVNNGLASREIGTIMTLVAIITIACASYLTQHDSTLFRLFDRWRPKLFERTAKLKERRPKAGYQLILFGYNRGGHEFVKLFQRLHKRYVVVDYDPAIIELLTAKQIPCLYGDATDAELLDEIGAQDARLVISTISDFETDEQLVRHINLLNPNAVVVCNANSYEEALQLYELGTSYVIIPHHASSEHLASLIERNGIDRKHFDRYRAKHLKRLEADQPLYVAEDAA